MIEHPLFQGPGNASRHRVAAGDASLKSNVCQWIASVPCIYVGITCIMIPSRMINEGATFIGTDTDAMQVIVAASRYWTLAPEATPIALAGAEILVGMKFQNFQTHFCPRKSMKVIPGKGIVLTENANALFSEICAKKKKKKKTMRTMNARAEDTGEAAFSVPDHVKYALLVV